MRVRQILLAPLVLAFLAALTVRAEDGQGPAADDPHVAAKVARADQDYFPFPNPGPGYVTDHADLLSLDEEERIERWLWQTESRTGVEVIVVTLNSIGDYEGTPNASIETFATALFNRYGIGNLAENNGVLLLVSTGDRKARIELGAGYGADRDADARHIMDAVIVPAFRKEEYAEGITDGVEAILLEFAHLRIGWNWPLIIVLISIPVVGLVAFSLFKNGTRGWGWICVGIILILILVAIWLFRQARRHMPSSSSSSWSSGGLGGFGGGFSGGGGATGSW